MFLPSGPYVTYQRFITKNEYSVMNKTSSTRSYVFSLCESDLLKWAWFNETIGMILEWLIQTGFVNCIALSQRSGSKDWFTRGAYMECNQQVPARTAPTPQPRPPAAMMSFCFNGWGRGCNRQLLPSSQSRPGKGNSGSLCPWSVGGSNGSAPLLHSQPSTWTHTAPSKKRNLQLDKKVRVYFESIEGCY